MEIETEGASAEQYQPSLKEEARRVWELYQSGVIRELYLGADPFEAVLMLECGEVHEAQQILAS